VGCVWCSDGLLLGSVSLSVKGNDMSFKNNPAVQNKITERLGDVASRIESRMRSSSGFFGKRLGPGSENGYPDMSSVGGLQRFYKAYGRRNLM